MINIHSCKFSRMPTYFKRQEIIQSSPTSKAFSKYLTPNTSSNSNWADSEKSIMCWAASTSASGAPKCWPVLCDSACGSDNLKAEDGNGASTLIKTCGCVSFQYNRMNVQASQWGHTCIFWYFPKSFYCNTRQIKFIRTCLIASVWTNSS